MSNAAEEPLSIIKAKINAGDPLLSLDVDPQHQYGFDPTTVEFIKDYAAYGSPRALEEETEWNSADIKLYLSKPNIKAEIVRIQSAMKIRQLLHPMYTNEALGGLVSSWLDDTYVPIPERLAIKDKIQVVKLLLDINKQNAELEKMRIDMVQPEYADITATAEELSVEELKNVIAAREKNAQVEQESEAIRNDLMKQIREFGSLDSEDLETLSALGIEELNTLLGELKVSEKVKGKSVPQGNKKTARI